MIEKWILPQLTIGQRGFETTVPLTEIVECIFHRLKTGCQWRELPTKQFFSDKALHRPAAHWNSVFYYYNKWSKADCWKKIWVNLLAKNLKHLDLSSVEFDGSHTPAKRSLPISNLIHVMGRESRRKPIKVATIYLMKNFIKIVL